MVKRRVPRRNRRKSARPRSQIARVASGIAIKPRRTRTDPPSMPIALNHSQRLRFNIVHQLSDKSKSGKFSVALSKSPLASNYIYLYYEYDTGAIARSFDLTFYDIALAACMSLFGVDVSKDKTTANWLATEFCIRKVTLYGSTTRSNPTEISLQMDAGATTPGFVGRDVGDLSRRAVVSATFPRFEWRYVSASPDATFLRADLGVQLNPLILNGNKDAPPNWPRTAGPTNFDAGVLDVSVMLRRAWAPSLSTAPVKDGNTTFDS